MNSSDAGLKSKDLSVIWFHIISLLIIAIWGTTFVSSKVLLLNGLSPVEILFIRFILAYTVIFAFSHSKLFAGNIKDELLFVLLGFFGGSLYFITENTALQIGRSHV